MSNQKTNELRAKGIKAVLDKLLAQKAGIEKNIQSLNEILSTPDLDKFDESNGRLKIVNAMVDDAVTGKASVESIKLEIQADKKKADDLVNSQKIQKSKALEEINLISSVLNGLDEQISQLSNDLNTEIKHIALARMEQASSEYKAAADVLFEKALVYYGAASLLGENCKHEFTRMVFEIPKAGVAEFSNYFSNTGSIAVSCGHDSHVERYKNVLLAEILG
jgi:hypothetical protein